MSTEEDFACTNFSPQRWRKDMCKNCYQSQRLHIKKQIRNESTASSPNSPKAVSPQTATKPFVPPSTPPLVSPTTPESHKPRGSIPAKPGPPARPGVPSKLSPPSKPKGSTSPPAKPKGSTSPKNEPKVFQRFRVNRDLGIDKSIPPRERTQQPELEGICPGTVKQKPSSQGVPPVATSSPPPPVIPPRPEGYNLSTETESSSTAQTPAETEQSPVSTTPAEQPPSSTIPAEAEQPPVSTTPAEQPPSSTIPAEAEQPPVSTTPAEQPPSSTIPAEAEQPPVSTTPAEQPPVSTRPAEQPPSSTIPAEAEQPPVSTTPAEQPPVSTMPAEQPPSSTIPAEAEQPPVSTTPAEQPPVSTTPAEQPPSSIIPAEAEQPPVSTSPAEQPPVSTTPAEQPPVSTTPAEQPPSSTIPAEAEQPPVSLVPTEQPPTSEIPAERPPISKPVEQPTISPIPAEAEQLPDSSVPAEQLPIADDTKSEAVLKEDAKEEIDALDAVQQPLSSDTSVDLVSISGSEELPVEQIPIPETKNTPVEDTSLSTGNQSADQPAIEELPGVVEQTVSDTSAVTAGEMDADSWVMVSEVVEQQDCPVVESGFNELGSSDETNTNKDDEQQQEQEVQQEQDGIGVQQSQESEPVEQAVLPSPAVAANIDETHDQVVLAPMTGEVERAVVEEVSKETDETLTSKEEQYQADQQLPQEIGDPEEEVKSKIVVPEADNEIQPIGNDVIPPIELNGVPAPPIPPPIVTQARADVVPAPPDLPGGVPAPPPPPPIAMPTPSPKLPRAKDIKKEIHSAKLPTAASAHEEAMEAIKGGIKLKVAPPPKQRAIGEEKIVDVASELRQKLLKKKKKETDTLASQLEAHHEEIQKMKEILLSCRGTHSFLHQLQSLLNQVDTLVAKTNVPPEILAQRLQWPTHLVDDLREVIEHMKALQMKVVAAENLCKRTLVNSMQPTGTGQVSSASSSNINPAAVEKCVQDMVMIAKELNTDESRYFKASQSFAVDESDMQRLIQRAADAVCPLLDKVYDKGFHAHSSIFEPSVTKFDQGFRVQNARRLLRLATSMSDLLSIHLQVPKHACYSEATLKCSDLPTDFHSTVKVAEREGEWETEEQLQLGSIGRRTSKSLKEDSQLTQNVMECLSSESGCVTSDLESQLTAAAFSRIELQLIKATMATGNLQTVSNLMALINKVYTGDNEAIHRHDFNWLLEAVTKGNTECLEHLVKSCEVFVNYQAPGGTTILHRAVQRQHLPTVAFLIRLGADPLTKNVYDSSPVQVLALKCFPPAKLTDKLEEKEPLFDLSSYINNPSLSDVILISSDDKRFSAHRIVLCAQSPVLKAMMESDIWAESSNKEIPLPTVSGKVVQFLLKYLYTGECIFPRDDLNLALELMAAADQFLLELMKQQCERVLCEKIDLEVAIPLYHAAFQFSAPKLLANSQHFVLTHYHELEDPNHELLLHILDNAVSGKQQ